MAFSQVLNFEGPVDALVWKHQIENFNTTTQLNVEATHEALFVVNGQDCDLLGSGNHTLETPILPMVNKIISIPTDGVTPFTCKVFFINKVHQMDLTWGIPGEITLDDPIYQIFLHIGMCGNMNFRISDSRKFMLKVVGFRDQFNPDEMVSKFRGIIKQYVKSYISKIMNGSITGQKVSYFDMNENLFEISGLVQRELTPIFDDYGIELLVFNIESITVPDEDYEAVKRAKEARASRIIQGYTWQEEKQMDIAKTFAGNEGTMGNIGGAVGGFMMGGAFGGSVADLARNALSPDRIPTQNPPSNLSGATSPVANNQSGAFDVAGFVSAMEDKGVHSQTQNGGSQTTSSMTSNGQMSGAFDSVGGLSDASASGAQGDTNIGGSFCVNCGNQLTADMLFCPKCGTRQVKECPKCHTSLVAGAKFCHKCGTQC